MPRIIIFSAVFVFGCALAHAETFTGRLLDANCAVRQANAYCTPNDATTAFALQLAGRTLRLDGAGNRKAADAMKANNNSADRSRNPDAPVTEVTAKIDGTLDRDTLQVDSIEIE